MSDYEYIVRSYTSDDDAQESINKITASGWEFISLCSAAAGGLFGWKLTVIFRRPRP